MLWILSSLLCVIFFLLYDHFTKYNNYWKDRNIPGPPPKFFFGNFKDIALRRRACCELYQEMVDAYPHEKYIGIFRMRTPVLLVKDLDIIKSIFIKDSQYFDERDIVLSKKDLGTNLFHANGDDWRVLRNRFTTIFTSGKLKNMVHLMNACGDKFIDYVEKITKIQPEHDADTIIKKFTQSNIASCAFGIDIDYETREEMLDKVEKKIFKFSHKHELEMMYPGILKRWEIGLVSREVCDFFRTLVKDVVDQKGGKPTNRNDFIDLLLALRNEKTAQKSVQDNAENGLKITDDLIAAQTFLFYSAGYKPSAANMSFMLYQLALYPEIQDKVVAEIKDVLLKHGQLTFDAVSEMKFMEKVVNETLRMFPVADSIRRRACADYKIPGTDLVLKKGQIIIVPISLLGDEKIYPDAKVFDPERFSPENVAARHSCAFRAFGLGPRQCIGTRFAFIQIKICMARLLPRFRVEPSKNTPREIKFESARTVQYPIGGLLLNFVKRE